MKEKITLQLPNKTVIFEVKDFGDSPVDTEELLQVDTNAIVADCCTFPVLFNRIGIIKAEMDNYLREIQMEFDIFEAEQRRKQRNDLVEIVTDSKGKEKKAYPTEQEIKDAVLGSPSYKVKRQNLNKVKYQADVIDALYWSAKSKDTKLNAISAKMKPEEFENEILEGVINSVQIKVQKSNFKERAK